jgi:hypothetical protein
MITKVDSELRSQAARFCFRFSCGSCIHYELDRQACSHGYPSEPHQQSHLEGVEELYFCKDFELG